MEAATQATIVCPSCQHHNQAGMLFCINCGNGLVKSADRVRSKTGLTSSKCPQCGKTDDLNLRFCIFCGHRIDNKSQSVEIATIVPPERRKSAAFVSFERAINHKELLTSSKRVAFGFNVFAGIFLALIGGIAVYPFIQVPTTDLTIYTNNRDASFTLASAVHGQIEKLEPCTYYIGRADGQGKFSFGIVPAGSYTLLISAPHCRQIMSPVNVENGHNTTIGSVGDPIVINPIEKN